MVDCAFNKYMEMKLINENTKITCASVSDGKPQGFTYTSCGMNFSLPTWINHIYPRGHTTCTSRGQTFRRKLRFSLFSIPFG